MTTVTARDFNRDVSAAKRAAEEGPVIITDRGRPSHVLLSFDTYSDLAGDRDVVDWLSMDDGIEFDPEPAHIDASVPTL